MQPWHEVRVDERAIGIGTRRDVPVRWPEDVLHLSQWQRGTRLLHISLRRVLVHDRERKEADSAAESGRMPKG